MTIFHYPFTKIKLSASCPLLSLIISFIILTKDHPPHWKQIQEESFQDHKQSSSGAQKKSIELILHESENVQTQEKHKQKKTRKRKKKGENEFHLKNEH